MFLSVHSHPIQVVLEEGRLLRAEASMFAEAMESKYPNSMKFLKVLVAQRLLIKECPTL